ncbi:17028_t:CDS:2, partial [Racocetra persica]
ELYPKAEKKLYNWITEQRKQGLGVSCELARIEMLNILKGPDMMTLYSNSTEDFKTSNNKRLPRGEKILSDIIAWFQDNGWMNSDLMIQYVDYVTDTQINNECEAVIPSGLTSICQPLDVAINKPFKDNLRKEWHLWMAKGGAGKTAARNLRRARISDVCEWVKNSWEQIPGDVIIKFFIKCGISNDLNENNDTDSGRLEDSGDKYKNDNIEIIDISKDDEIIYIDEDDEIIYIDEDDEIIDIDDDDEFIDMMNISDDMEMMDISDDNEIIDISDNIEIMDISDN